MNAYISVIVPVYNAEKTLERCVSSILKQTWEDLELILIDDGSMDGSGKLCDMAAARDSRVIVRHQKNAGVSSARNYGLSKAKGTYVMFADSDDWLEQGAIRHYAEIMQQHPCDLIIGGIRKCEKDGRISVLCPEKTGYYNTELWNKIGISSELYGYLVGKLFKLDIIQKKQISFNENMASQEDLDFCLRYYRYCEQFYETKYIAYQYMYESGKRVPPYCDFIRNQMNLLKFAEEKTKLVSEARTAIEQRICEYVYGMLYAAGQKNQLEKACRSLMKIDGIDDILAGCALTGERKWLVSWLLKGRWKQMQRYWILRRYARKVLKGKE